MSESTGFIIIYSQKELDLLALDIKDGTELHIDGDDYEINRGVFSDFVSLSVFTSEYSDIENFKKYIFKKYKPEILISSFDNKSYLKTLSGKKIVSRSNAYKKLAEISPLIDFYVSMSISDNYSHALELLEDKKISLNDICIGVTVAERCFSSDAKKLIVFAIENGFHNHICEWDYLGYLDTAIHLLHRLRSQYDLNLIKLALDYGADPNAEDDEGGSLLHQVGDIAFYYEEPDFSIGLIDLLHQYQADFNKKNNKGENILLSIKKSYDDEKDPENESDPMKKILFNIIQKLLICDSSIIPKNKDGIRIVEYYKDVPEVYDLLSERLK